MRSITLFVCVLSLAMAQSPRNEGATGTVAGSAFDAASGAPVPLVKVTVKENPSFTIQTDTNGKFAIKLPPGTYTLTFAGANHMDAEVDQVIVTAGEVAEASTVLSPKGAVTTVEVVEKVGAVQSTAEASLAERKLSGSVSDAVSNEELRGGTASNAAAALEKVTGVSVVDNGFVYVRGLGERYSATQLNNAVIPTTEPERRVVPLDLFPAAMIDSIRILKTYSPDLPAEFSGGLVDMKTVEFPNKPVLKFSGNMGFNGVTTFNRFGTYPGGGRDVFGFDDGTRGLPAGIPDNRRLFQGQFTNQQLTDFGRLFPVNWEPTAVSSMRPNQSYSVTGGGTFGRLGLVGAVSFSNKPQLYDEQRRFYRTSGGRPIEFTRYDDFRDSVEQTRTGGVFNAAIRLTAANKLVFRNTLTHDSDKESRIIAGYEGGIDGDILTERLRWVERNLRSHSLEGEHAFSNLKSSILRWQFTYSRSTRNEPDLREVIRGKLPDGRFQFLQQSLSGQRFFNNLGDDIYEPQVEWGVPFYKGAFSGLFRAGFRATLRTRDFQARRFRYVPFQASNINLFAPSNQLFAPENIASNRFVLVETTRGTDRYDASMDVYAGFAMVDMAIGPKWRLVGGFRVEDANIQVTTIDPLVPGTQPARSSLVNRDPLPALNAIYALTRRQNLRFAYSQTLSRPDFRELSPFDFTNVVGGFNTVGNPDLRRTKIQNFDARWEWFLGGNQIIAASYFLKSFDDPIETTVQAVADFRQSFINADSARNQGIELEYRQNLGKWSKKLSQFALQSNFTYVNSRVTLPEEQALILTSKSRALVGQSPFLFNVIAEWVKPKWRSNSRFYVNSVSRRITDVGTFNLPDIYQERNTILDFVYQYNVTEDERWVVKFSAQNLTDNRYRWTQADLLWRQFQTGRTFEVGLSFSLFR
ncbi:MAG: TonB-dependent receptor [Bryobacterales bacterium]|nr:TonB-dependent receptor [Bryobacterales bacterium]